MNTFSQVNKKNTRVSNCCRAGYSIKGDVTKFHVCNFCDKPCDIISFYEELTENLSNVLLGCKVPLDIICGNTGELLVPANRKFTKTLIRKIAANYEFAECDPSPVRNRLREIIITTAHKFGIEYTKKIV